VAEGLSGDPPVVELDELLPGSDLKGLLRWTAEQAAKYDQIAWVGHAPDVGRLTADLIGETDGWIRFAKGGVAAVRFEDLPQLGQGELRWLVTAKLLGC
jgi:phosphohistidine phosphatase SixA